MLELGEIVVVTMNDDRGVSDIVRSNCTSVVSVWRGTADTLGESESQETDTRHHEEDQADDAHFLSPGTLLFGTRNAARS